MIATHRHYEMGRWYPCNSRRCPPGHYSEDCCCKSCEDRRLLPQQVDQGAPETTGEGEDTGERASLVTDTNFLADRIVIDELCQPGMKGECPNPPGFGCCVTTAAPPPDSRAALLDEAKSIVVGARAQAYGQPEDNFRRIADLWRPYLRERYALGFELEPHDVAVLMILMKMARAIESPEKRDNWVDTAGYAACGYSTVATSNAEGAATPLPPTQGT